MCSIVPCTHPDLNKNRRVPQRSLVVSEELVWLSGWEGEGQAVEEDRVLSRTPSTTGWGRGEW